MDKGKLSRDHVPSLGPRARERREASQLSVRDAGEQAGVDFASLHRVEVGKRAATLATAIKFARLYRTSIDYLGGLTDDPRPVGEILIELGAVKRQLAAATRSTHKSKRTGRSGARK